MRRQLLSLFFRRSSVGDGSQSLFLFQDFPGNIKGAVAGPVVVQIRIAVIAGADDVRILCPDA
jgi:hypothetical protein